MFSVLCDMYLDIFIKFILVVGFILYIVGFITLPGLCILSIAYGVSHPVIFISSVLVKWFLLSIVLDTISVVYSRMKLAYKYSKLPKTKDDVLRLNLDVKGYVLYLYNSSFVNLDIFNVVLLIVGFPLNLFLLIINGLDKYGDILSFDWLFGNEISNTLCNTFRISALLTNEVYGCNIDVYTLDSIICYREFSRLEEYL